MNVVILSSGASSRLGPLAPHGCKSLIEIGGRTVLDHQLAALPDVASVRVVCRSDAAPHIPADTVIYDEMQSAVHALRNVVAPDLLVIFCDTLFDEIPDTRHLSWVGVAHARGGRDWEFSTVDGRAARAYLPPNRVLAVHVGMYFFPNQYRLARSLHDAWSWPDLLNRYGMDRDEIVTGWRDVGDPDALARTARELVAR